MNRRVRRTQWYLSLMCLAAVLFAASDVFAAVDKAKIKEAILKGQEYLLRQKLTGAQGSIAVLAYIKSGGSKKAAVVEEILLEVLKKTQSGIYQPTGNYNYEAGVDLMLLEAIDAETYRPQMEMIVTFLLKTQRSNGAWFYDYSIQDDCGDTSITQYALLGLWAAARAGIEIPIDVWENAARWHITKHQEDGGFAYHPYEWIRVHLPEQHVTTATMTVVGSSNLLIIRRVLFSDADLDSELRPTDSKRRFGVLERFIDEKPGQKVKLPVTPTLRPAAIDKVLKESVRWTSSHFIDKSSNTEIWYLYYLYSIERVAALMDIEKLGTQDWYEEGSNILLKRQAADGSWTDNSTAIASTAFGIMFLSKATSTVVAPKKRLNLLGGGLQAGGRGLPDNLDAVVVKEGSVTARKISGPVDNLLIELERSADAKVEDVQASVVEAVQLDRPEELIGNVVRLCKLARDSRVEVRRTAYWALGRSGDVSAAKVLIQGLSDPEISVIREASVGLCILSRRPDGCGKPIDPTDDNQMNISDAATDDERNAKINEWQKESKKRWLDWYQKNRPYDERDDRSMLKQPIK